MATFFFCGIGGIGMSAIALYLKRAGHTVLGSDRAFDQHHNEAIKKSLERQGSILFLQDASGVTSQIDTFVVSTAVEDFIPDIKKAKELGLNIQKRAQVLADIFHQHEKSIAVAGTSGKTTVTAMVGHILYHTGCNPVMINGGISLNTYNNEENSNLIYADSDICVIESDESDGSIELYTPFISVVTNVSLDHKPLDEIRPLFANFLNRTQKGIVINADCKETPFLKLSHPNVISFSIQGKKEATLQATDISFGPGSILFSLNQVPCSLPLIGLHNLENALAAIGACLHLEVSATESIKALQSFSGTKRRLQTIGEVNHIYVIDDYGHNPEKIKATLSSLQLYNGRIFVVYQPHGFAPLKLMKNDLIEMLMHQLDHRTTFIMSDVYYVGGTVNRSMSSAEIIEPLQQAGKKAFYIETRSEIIDFLIPQLEENDRIVIMGARDDTLSDFAQTILDEVKEKACRL